MDSLIIIGIFRLALLFTALIAIYWSFKAKKYSLSLAIILLSGLLLRVQLALKAELNIWDEQFHAIVAKNMFSNPFAPMLYSKEFEFLNPGNWTFCHIWLSKPPLTFWILALSLKTFGINELGLRLPSILFGVASIYLTYKLGLLLYNKKTGLLSAFFHAINGLFLELNSGKISSDHVDTLYLFLCELTIYFFLKHKNNLTRKICLQIGVLIGLAFLTKWIMAFLLFLVIVPWILYSKEEKKVTILTQIVAGFVTISVPWVIYLTINFQTECEIFITQLFEPLYKTIHLDQTSKLFYVDEIRKIISEIVYAPLLFLLYYFYKRKSKTLYILFIWIILPILLLSIFSFKKNTYVLFVAPALFILIALFIQYINLKLFKKQVFLKYVIVGIILVLPVRYCIERLKPFELNAYPSWRTYLDNFLLKNRFDKQIIIVNDPKAYQTMFYYNDIYSFENLTDEQINTIKTEDYNIFRFKDGKLTHLVKKQ